MYATYTYACSTRDMHVHVWSQFDRIILYCNTCTCIFVICLIDQLSFLNLYIEGVVTGLLGVPVSHVSIGRSHICVLTQLGTVYTFGGNQYGQCGRNYVPPEEGTVCL